MRRALRDRRAASSRSVWHDPCRCRFPRPSRSRGGPRLRPIDDIAAQMGIEPELLEPYGAARRQGQPRRRRRPGRPAAGPLRRGDRRHPDPARRGQDHHDGRPRSGHGLHRAPGDHRHPPGLHGPDLRDQGRRGRWWLQPGRPVREPEPASDRRPARGDGGQQPPGRHGGQPPLQRERAGPRSARRHVEARARRQRPLAAQHRERARARSRTARRGRPGSTSPRRPR